jgi:hypothetical protein
MTNPRADAYRRILHMLRDIGPASLWPREQACIRDAADALLFCRDIAADVEARVAIAVVTRLADEMIEAERMTPARARTLLDDIWACGPLAAVDISLAA